MQWRAATLDDPVLQPLRDLKARRGGPHVIIEGITAVRRAIAAGWPVHVVLATESATKTLPPLPAGTEGRIAAPGMLREVVGFAFHRGCIAVAGRAAPPDPAAWLSERARTPEPWRIVIAEEVSDPTNLGALVRNARGFGAAAVVFVGGGDPLQARAVRASMGHIFSQPFLRARRLDPVLDAILAARPEARIVAASVDPRAQPLDAYDPPACIVLLVGAEGEGLSAQALQRAHDHVTIPMSPDVDSLNVAAATAVLLWALRNR